ncbi:MAG: efflux RND transporter periplasmic adaptor subunit [Planctomycetes bacterium]|nr:efflux RND transporter periplasmic adaptor subunit [Planctomycetota bacterium]
MRALLIIVTGLLVATGSYAYWGRNGSTREQRYHTGEVTRRSIVSTVEATGTVEPLLTVLVGSQVSGTVVRWYTDFNQLVKQGDVLAELDQDQFKATIAERNAMIAAAKARVEEASARLETAELDLRRIQHAFTVDSASDAELDEARAVAKAAVAAMHTAEAEVQVGEARLQAAIIQLDKTIIRSPIDGIVITRNVDAGQTVAASLSAPTLFAIANDLKRMRVNAAVSETDIGHVREGMPARFRVDAYPNRYFVGAVSQVRFAQTVVDNVVTYETLIEVDNEELLLRPGMTATIIFEVERADDTLTIPNAALRFDPTQDFASARSWTIGKGEPTRPRVFKLGSGGVIRVDLELGIRAGSRTQILGGDLVEGDTLVVGWDLRKSRSSRRRPRGF